MSAQDYPVTFPYGATSKPYSATRPHRGNDRRMATGTPVIVGGTQIGLSGASGDVTGPHLHTQAGTDLACQNTFEPSALEFKAGTVINRRTTDPGTAGSWGKFVTVQVGSQYITYAHLSRVDVEVGRILAVTNPPQGGETPMTTAEAKAVATAMFRQFLKREPDASGLANYTNHIKAGNFDFAFGDVAGSPEFKNANTVEKVVEKPIQVPVEKIVYQDNPEQQAKLDKVTVERNILESERNDYRDIADDLKIQRDALQLKVGELEEAKKVVVDPSYFSIGDLIKGIIYKLTGKEWKDG